MAGSVIRLVLRTKASGHRCDALMRKHRELCKICKLPIRMQQRDQRFNVGSLSRRGQEIRNDTIQLALVHKCRCGFGRHDDRTYKSAPSFSGWLLPPEPSGGCGPVAGGLDDEPAAMGGSGGVTLARPFGRSENPEKGEYPAIADG